MNIKQAKQEILHTVTSYLKKDASGVYRIPTIRQRPILMIGPPGVGKTQIMEQIAAETGIGLVSYTITHHTRQTAVGLPFIKEEEFDGETYSVTEYTMSEIIASIHREMARTGVREGILFIDEINCVSETLAPTMLQFLQCKTFGNQEVPEGWIIVAAGNPPEYNKSVREFDVVTLDRVRQISVEADYGVWKEYAASLDTQTAGQETAAQAGGRGAQADAAGARRVGGMAIHRAIRAYLDLHPEDFYRMETDTDGRHFVTARGWEDLSNLLTIYHEDGIPVTEEVIYEYLSHHEVAENFASYLEMFFKYEEEYPMDRILAGDVPSVIYERLLHADFDERVTVVQLLTKALLNRIQEYSRSRQAATGAGAGTTDTDALCGQVKTAMENAFAFMESAFSRGEEMVLFVTELTITEDSVLFLAENPNEKYLAYSEELLIGSRRSELMSEIKRGK
ncbi:MAG: AAA family ATPase [Eubacterium sp.]|nr:AAA family ATPase [Eubacterium sp.]